MEDEPALVTCHLGFFRDDPEIVAQAFTLHKHWTQGILPASGGVEDQPAVFSDVVFCVETAVNEANTVREEISKREASRKAGTPNKKGRGL